MAVLERTNSDSFTGLSTDTKPSAPGGSIFYEIDTGRVYINIGAANWTLFLPGLPEAIEGPLGNLPGVSGIDKFGRNPNIGTTLEDVWGGGGIHDEPQAGRIHQLVSDDSADDGSPVGTGAHSVLVNGLDDDDILAEETVILDGTNDVATTKTYKFIHRMRVTAAGSGKTNAGTITATADVDGTVSAQINPGKGRTLMAIFKIPAATTGILSNWYGVLGSSSPNSNIEINLAAKRPGEIFVSEGEHGLISKGSSHFNHLYLVKPSFPALTVLKVQAIADSQSTVVSGGFGLTLVS